MTPWPWYKMFYGMFKKLKDNYRNGIRKEKTIRTRNKKHGSQVEILKMTLVGILKRTELQNGHCQKKNVCYQHNTEDLP